MRSALKKRIVKGVFAKGFGHGTLLVTRLAEIPLFLYFWGAELYGEWLILAALPMYLSLSDFGFSGAAAREITMLTANKQKQSALAVFQTISIFIIALFSLILLVLLSGMVLLPVEQLFSLTHIDRFTFIVVTGLLGLSSILLLLMRLLMGPYNSAGRFSTGYLLITFTLTGQFGAAAVVTASGSGPLVVAAVMLVTQIIGLVLMRSMLYRIAPWIHIGCTHFKCAIVFSLAKPSFAGMAIPMGQAMSLSGIRIVIGIILGPIAVVSFVAHRQLARLVIFVSTFSQPFEAELSRSYGSGDKTKFISLSRMTTYLLFWSVLAALLVVWTMSDYIFHLWLGGKVTFDTTLFALLIFVSLLEALWIITLSPAISINHHIEPAKKYALISFALIPLAYFACAWGGLYPLSLVLAMMETIMLVIVVRQLLSISGDRFVEWLHLVVIFPFSMLRSIIGTLGKGS